MAKFVEFAGKYFNADHIVGFEHKYIGDEKNKVTFLFADGRESSVYTHRSEDEVASCLSDDAFVPAPPGWRVVFGWVDGPNPFSDPDYEAIVAFKVDQDKLVPVTADVGVLAAGGNWAIVDPAGPVIEPGIGSYRSLTQFLEDKQKKADAKQAAA